MRQFGKRNLDSPAHAAPVPNERSDDHDRARQRLYGTVRRYLYFSAIAVVAVLASGPLLGKLFHIEVRAIYCFIVVAPLVFLQIWFSWRATLRYSAELGEQTRGIMFEGLAKLLSVITQVDLY